MERDLSIGKHPLLMGRTWPTTLHHWKAAELEVFLQSNSYPAHTHRDQLEAHRRACIEAILKGKTVPPEVLAEDDSILDDVEMHRMSDITWKRFGERLDAKKAEFEGVIGFLTSPEMYMKTLQDLIEHTVKQHKTAGPNQMLATWKGWELSLQIDEGRPRSLGYFGAYGGRLKKLNIFLGENRFGISCIHSVDWRYVDQLLNNIWLKDRASIEDIWFLTGTGWTPTQASVTHYRDSLQLTAA